MGKSFPHLPVLAQEADCSYRIDPPDKMNAAGGKWQLFRKRMELLPGQSVAARGTLCLRRSQSLQPWGMVLRHVPGQKLWATRDNGRQRLKAVTIPETACPQPVDPFYYSIALGFSGRDEDQLDSQVQTQADEGAKAAWGALAACERNVIVEL
jgi:hypothetical protein